MESSYLGHNVATIHSMPMGGNGYKISDKQIKDLKDLINSQPHKYLTVITADFYQSEQISPMLKKNGFKSQVTFRSQHGGRETLTLWTKIQKNKKDTAADTKTVFPNYNCSVSYAGVSVKNFSLILKDLKDNKSSIAGLKRIKNTPICYVVKSHAATKELGEKVKYMIDKMREFKMRPFYP
jgi:hypothetical protein